jgi:Putative zinc-finger
MTECNKIGVMLSAFGDGELGPRARRKVESHLLLCSTCIASLSDYSTLSSELKKIIEMPKLEGFAHSVMEKIGKLIVIIFLMFAMRGGHANQRPARSVDVRVDSMLAISQPGVGYGTMSHRAKSAGSGQAVAFSLPDGGELRVRARATDDGMIAMHLVLISGGHHRTMTTEVRIKAGTTFFYTGQPSPEGTLMLRVIPSTPSRPRGEISAQVLHHGDLAG